MTYCSKCGFELDSGVNFCPDCGEKILEEEEKCSNCGKLASDGDKFCVSCGSPLKGEDNRTDDIVVSGEDIEKVTGVIPYTSTGMLGRDSFNIVVTTRRLIFAKYTSELMKKEQEKTLGENQGGGFFSRWKNTISAGMSFHERYYDMNPQEIMHESADNYEVRPGEIVSVEVRSGRWGLDDDKRSPNELEIKWSGGKNKFKFTRINSNQAKEILKPLLGGRLR